MKMQGNAMEIIVKMAGICWPTEGGVGKDSECTEGVWEEWQCPGMMSKCSREAGDMWFIGETVAKCDILIGNGKGWLVMCSIAAESSISDTTC